MRSFQLVVAACVGAVLALVVVARKQQAVEPAPIVVAGVRQDVIDYQCYSCGSGNGPGAWELIGLLHLAGDEAVVKHDAGWGQYQWHGQFHDYLIASPRGVRRAVVLLH